MVDEPVESDGTPPRTRQTFEGVDYDYVWDVDIKEGEPVLKLPYNLGDDVEEVASAFVKLHSLPLVYQSQIEEFIGLSSQ